MNKKYPVFDYTDCMSCSICEQACPVSALTMTKPGKQGKFINVFPELVGDDCIGCGICAKNCPMDVITMQEETPA